MIQSADVCYARGRDWLLPSRQMSDAAWELDVYPEKVLPFCFLPCVNWPCSTSVCLTFGIFSVITLLAIEREDSKRSVEEMVLR